LGIRNFLEGFTLFPAPRVAKSVLKEQAARNGAQEIHLTTSDGVRLYGWWMQRGNSRAILYFSGNRSTCGSNPPRYARLLDAGFDILHVNYRGYPGSRGRPSETGLREDARTGWKEITRLYPAENVLVLGSSLGGGVAIGVAAEFDPGALLLLATFHSARRVACEQNPAWLVRATMVSPFDSAALAPRVTCPTMLVHGDADELIDLAQAQDLAACFPQPPLLHIVPGALHPADLLADPQAWEEVSGWLESLDWG
jgi:fermentation-respiration switch protein FrsA (DUF1100 family)